MVTSFGSMRTAIATLLADRASRLNAAIGGSVVLCLVLLGAYLCLDLHDTAWRNAERNADNLLTLIEEGVGRNARLYDQSLMEAARLAGRPDIAALDSDLRRLVLFDTPVRSGSLGRIALTDASGQVQLTSDAKTGALPDLAELPEFGVHRADPSAGLIVTGPVRALLSGRMIMRMTRRIDTPDGSFAGIVAGAIYLDYFQELFERLRIDPGSAISIFQQNGRLLVRSPARPDLVGRSIADGGAYRRFRAQPRGHYVGRSLIDGRLRLHAFANLPDLPLLVTVAADADSIRAAWIGKAAIVAALVIGLSVLTFGLTIPLQREIGRRAAREASSRADNVALAQIARTDALTGLPNRRGYDEALGAAWARAARMGGPLALMIVDADHFKQFNDRFGHRRGDEVLRTIAGCLRDTIEPAGGVSCRVGGEEFAAILPALDGEAARDVAERLRRAVVKLRIAHATEFGGVATVSVGLAWARPRRGGSPEALFAAADDALYAAKTAGRNRVRAAMREAGSLALSA